jgi:hypothetical protein
MCYPNTTATAPHKLSPRSTWCVLSVYSVDHKGYHCLDLSTNCLIVSRHVVFDDDSFPLAASPSLTDLDFLCASGPMISTIRTHLTTAGTSPLAPCRPAPEIPPGFVPPMANLPTPIVPPGFLPRAATTVASPPITIGPPTRTWPVSPVTYVRREVGARATGTRGAPGPAPSPEVGAGATGRRGAPGAALCREVNAGTTGPRGAPRAALGQEVGTGATGPRGALGAALHREVGAGAARTHGAPGPAPRREVGAGVTGTHDVPRAALRREMGAGATVTRGGPKATLRREVRAGAAMREGCHQPSPRPPCPDTIAVHRRLYEGAPLLGV